MNRRINSNIYLVISMFLLVMVSAATAKTIFVDVNADGNNNGSSWADAYNHLQDALTAASSGDEIWVAKGIYKPDQGNGITLGNRNATFRLKTDVAIYGGFPSGGSNWEDSNPVVYETTLSGDLNGNDIKVATPADLQGEPTRAENSYHVVTSSGTNRTAVLDGFTIIAGTSEGGGIFNDAGSPTVINCIFSGHASNLGSAMSNRKNSKPNIINCKFSGNWARWGAVMRNADSDPNITGCIFEENSGEVGGALSNSWCSPTFTNCTFSRNCARDTGGAMRNYYSNPTFTNCTFSANLAGGYGGVIYNFNGSPTLVNCTFSGNSARKFGGAIANSKSKPTFINCTFSGNSATLAGGIHNTNRSNPTLTNCILWGNSDNDGMDESAQIVYGVRAVVNYCCIQGWTGQLGGTGNINADPLFTRNPNDGGDGWGDDLKTLDVDEGTNDDFGDLHLLPDSPCINAGDPSFIAGPNDVDMDGNQRTAGGQIDMGAYEYIYGEL